MKKFMVVSAMAMVLISTSAHAAKILLPASKCDTVQSASYSTGNGDQAIQYAKILCKKGNSYWLLMPQKVSKAGLFGKITGSRTVGRMFSSSEVELEITNKVEKAEFD